MTSASDDERHFKIKIKGCHNAKLISHFWTLLNALGAYADVTNKVLISFDNITVQRQQLCHHLGMLKGTSRWKSTKTISLTMFCSIHLIILTEKLDYLVGEVSF